MRFSKYLAYLTSVIFVGFLIYASAVQLNDPDGIVWAAAYGVAAVAIALMSLRAKCSSMIGRIIALPYAFVSIYLLASVDSWDGWIEVEIAREGLGLLITTAMLLTASLLRFDRS